MTDTVNQESSNPPNGPEFFDVLAVHKAIDEARRVGIGHGHGFLRSGLALPGVKDYISASKKRSDTRQFPATKNMIVDNPLVLTFKNGFSLDPIIAALDSAVAVHYNVENLQTESSSMVIYEPSGHTPMHSDPAILRLVLTLAGEGTEEYREWGENRTEHHHASPGNITAMMAIPGEEFLPLHGVLPVTEGRAIVETSYKLQRT